MKRFFFTVIALAAVAVSCTKSGILESPHTYESPISFEPYTGKAPVTKATIESNTTITSGFRVLGFVETTADNGFDVANPYLRKFVRFGDHDGDKATAETPTPDTWFYSGAMYWPEGKELTFVAYGLNVNGTPAEATGADAGDAVAGTKFAQSATDYTSYTYTVGATADVQKDLVISPAMQSCTSSYPSGAGVAVNENKTVNVQLYHVLSRIGFKVAVDADYTVKDEHNNSTTQYSSRKVTINNISLTGNFITEGAYDLRTAVQIGTDGSKTYATPGGTAATATYTLFSGTQSCVVAPTNGGTYDIYDTSSIPPVDPELEGDEKEAAEAAAEAATTAASNNRYMMIIPGDPGDGAIVTVSYQIEGGESTSVELPLSNDLVFAAGKAYEFVFTVSNVAVGFDVRVTDWNTNLDGDNATNDDIQNNIN